MKQFLLGIDIGTSACKIAVFDIEGNVIAAQSGEYQVFYPHSGWAEQAPDEWWSVVCKTMKALFEKSGIDAGDIAGIGIDGQSWSAIPIDQEGKVLCNTPIWFDTRAAEICSELKSSVGEDEIFRLCGNPVQPSYTLPKILWYKKHRPEVYRKTYKILQSNSFICFKLTDVISGDLSQGYGMHCFDIQNGRWSLEMCKELGVNPEFLPPLYQCHDIVGKVSAKAASETGLAIGTPVVAGGLDAACGTLGAGVVRAGQTQEQGGQAGGMSICTAECVTDIRMICGFHVVPDLWLLQGGTVGGGGVMQWMEKEFGGEERISAKNSGRNSFALMDDEAALIPAGSDGVVFLPYMAGERSPIWDTNAKGVFYGLDFSKTKAHMIRAALEGTAFSLKHNLDTARAAGAEANELHSMGGAANSKLWVQIKADVTGKKIVVPSSDTATTLGAAILAGVGTGIYASFEDAVHKTVKITREQFPNMENHAAYRNNYSIYLELYEKLKDTMRKSNELINGKH
jgi:xylulokinase